MTMDVKAEVIDSLNNYCEISYDTAVLEEGLTLDQLELDSLAVLELIYELEEKFQIELESSQLRNLETVSQLIALFELNKSKVA